MFINNQQMHQIKCYIMLVQRAAPVLSRRQEVVEHLRTLQAKDTVCSDKVSMFVEAPCMCASL